MFQTGVSRTNAVAVMTFYCFVCMGYFSRSISTESNNCFKLLHCPPPTSPGITDTTRKKSIVWLDVMHDVHGLRHTYRDANFSRCKGLAGNCKIKPHVIARQPRYVRGDRFVGPVDADAVLIMGTHLTSLPIPVRRDPDQVFVFVEPENWFHYKTYKKIEYWAKNFLLRDHMHYFNWTMTYRVDSDIIFPYGLIAPKRNYIPPPMSYFDDVWNKKKYSVAWLVSHCIVPSARGHFVAKLKQYIDIHVYGLCGNLVCKDEACFKKIVEEHKFILAFENTYYQNYITEKLFDGFEDHIVQVTRGGGIHYSLYGVPEGAIIDADMFCDVKSLADTLDSIGNDKEKYLSYIRTKHRHFSVTLTAIREAAHCELCAKLNNVNSWRKSYSHIGGWYASNLFDEFYCPNKEWVRNETELDTVLEVRNDKSKQRNPLLEVL